MASASAPRPARARASASCSRISTNTWRTFVPPSSRAKKRPDRSALASSARPVFGQGEGEPLEQLARHRARGRDSGERAAIRSAVGPAEQAQGLVRALVEIHVRRDPRSSLP